MKVARAVGMGAILILALMAGVFIVDTLAAGAAPGAEGEPPAAAVDKAKSDAARKELEELKKRGYAPLKLKLPTAKVLGTRKDFTTPNLEKNPLAPRKPFWAPKGLTNVAKGKPVTTCRWSASWRC